MVKGISRQVIVMQSPDKQLFDQAIFILREDAVGKGGVTDDVLLKEARRLLGSTKSKHQRISGPAWACGGALATGILWLLTVLL